MEQLVKGKSIDVSKVSTSAPKPLDNGSKLVYVNYGGPMTKFNVQTPWMELAWPVNCYTEGTWPKYSQELSFRGSDEGGDIGGFLDKFTELDEHLIDAGVENSVSWFKIPKKKATREAIETMYNCIVKRSKDKETGEPDGKWPSTFRVKIPFKNDRFECKLYDTDGNMLNINDPESGHKIEDILLKGTRVRCIIQCVGLWVASGNYMCQWKLVKAEVEVQNNPSTYDFLEDSDNEESVEDNGGDGREPTMLDDSEDEEVAEDAEDEAPASKPKLKMKLKKSSK